MSLRMRGAAFAALAVLSTAVLPGAASAQGFFGSLFGWGGGAQPPPAAPRPPARHATPPPVPPALGHRAPLYDPHPPDRAEQSAPEQGGRFRTMCVRLCDGYYWPINNNVGRSRFYRDARACRSSCGEESRLFFHSSSSGDASGMVDQQGRPYVQLPNAFKYRKQLVDGCRCRPEPWSETELDRHRVYAMNEMSRRQLQDGEAGQVATGPRAAGEVIAGDYRQERVEYAQAEPAEAAEPATAGEAGEPARGVAGPVAAAAGQAPMPAAAAPDAPEPTVAPAAAAPVKAPRTAGRRRQAAEPAVAAARQAQAGQRPKAKPAPAVKLASATKALGSPPNGLGGTAKRWPGD